MLEGSGKKNIGVLTFEDSKRRPKCSIQKKNNLKTRRGWKSPQWGSPSKGKKGIVRVTKQSEKKRGGGHFNFQCPREMIARSGNPEPGASKKEAKKKRSNVQVGQFGDRHSHERNYIMGKTSQKKGKRRKGPKLRLFIHRAQVISRVKRGERWGGKGKEKVNAHFSG